MNAEAPLVVNGWRIVAHPLFLAQVEAMAADVERVRRRDPQGFARHRSAKKLAAVWRVALEVIPRDPASVEFWQGLTLGAGSSHWRRAKFLQQYRLFFRYHSSAKVIVLAWANDESTLRAYDSHDDAYRTFSRMLDSGTPPSDWSELLSAARPL